MLKFIRATSIVITLVVVTPALASSGDDELRGKLNAIEREYAAELKAARDLSESGKKPAQPRNLPLEYSTRFLELAESAPNEPAARDALLWIVDRILLHRPDDVGTTKDVARRAIDLLILHHADDLEVARFALLLDNSLSPNRDRLFQALYANARDREAKGTATLGLAQYLIFKAKMIEGLRSREARMPIWTEEYERQVRGADAAAIRTEAIGLLRQVIDEYKAVKYIRVGNLSAEDRRLDRSLANVAESRLDDLIHLAVGQPAPEIAGVDLEGNPMKLSDYRGKVVVLSFWGSWCEPCLAEVPRERELVERHRGRPFALLGVDCEDDREIGRKAAAEHKMSWPSWFDETSGDGPIARQYHIRSFPTVFLIDDRGVIRRKRLRGDALDRAVAEFLDNLEKRAPGAEERGK